MSHSEFPMVFPDKLDMKIDFRSPLTLLAPEIMLHSDRGRRPDGSSRVGREQLSRQFMRGAFARDVGKCANRSGRVDVYLKATA